MWINFILFQGYPYIAFFIFIGVTWFRCSRVKQVNFAEYKDTVNTKLFRVSNSIFHYSVTALLLCHLIGLLTPERVYAVIITPHLKHYIAILVGGLLGGVCFIAMTILVMQKITHESRKKSPSIIFLFAIYFQLILGLCTIIFSKLNHGYSDMIALSNWAQNLMILNMKSYKYIIDVPLVYKIHLVWGITLFVIFPFTKLVYVVRFL